MAQHDYVIDNSTGANVRADINSVLQAIASNNSGSSDPSTTVASQFFADTNAGIMKLRNTSNNGFVNLFTLAGGIDVDAASNFNEDVTFTGATSGRNIVFDKSDNAFEFADNAKAKFGDSDDLQIYHTGTQSFVQDTGTGNLNLQGTSKVVIGNAALDENMAQFFADGAVELYFDNSKKFETTSGGAELPDGSVLTVQTTSTSNGFLSFLDIGNVGYQWKFPDNNTVQFGTNHGSDKRLQLNNEDASSHFHFSLADNGKMLFGNNDDLQIYHDGSNSFAVNSVGQLLLRSTTAVQLGSPSGEPYVIGLENGQVELYHDNSKKMETVSNGIEVTGHVRPISSRDNTDDLGGSSQRWDDIFATNSTIQTSDQKEKENISDTDLGLDFINKLTPKSFKFKGKTRTHYGLIAQDIETVITDLGKTTTQFAPLIKNKLEDGTERYGLRYTELLSPLIKAVQELSAKVAALEAA